jgi:hypothetical protein
VKRYVLAILLGMSLSAAAWPQDAGQDDTGTADKPAQAADKPADQSDDQTGQDDAKDDTGLDEQGYKDQDDDFKPSEDIPADQSIAFPTDI